MDIDMKLTKAIACALILFLFGCETLPTQQSVTVNYTAFFADQYMPEGVIAVRSGDANLANSLEFQSYKTKFEAKLASVGYTIASSKNEADYIAFVTYGIGNGETKTGSVPIIGQTGGGSTYTSGTVYGAGGSATYNANSYSMPTYGVVGSRTVSSKSYTRAIAMDIVEANSLSSEVPTKVYEGRAKSTGYCSVIVEVFDEILEAMFIEYATNNGSSKIHNIKATFNC